MSENIKKSRLIYGLLFFFAIALTGCEVNNQCYYDISSYGSVASARVFYPCGIDESNDLYVAATLSGGFTNTKEQMYWIAEHLQDEGFIVFAISAQNNSSVAGYANAHESAVELMDRENSDPSSPVYGKIGQKALIGYSMGGGAVCKVGSQLGSEIGAVIGLAPFNPGSNLSGVDGASLMIVGQNDSIAPATFAVNAYRNIPDSTTKCVMQLRSFGHLQWVSNSSSNGDTPKLLIADWLDLNLNGNTSKRSTFTNPPSDVVSNTNNL